MAYVARMHQYYMQEVVPVLQQRFGYRNVMQVPRLEKIVLNMGLGEAIQNPKLLMLAWSNLPPSLGRSQ